MRWVGRPGDPAAKGLAASEEHRATTAEASTRIPLAACSSEEPAFTRLLLDVDAL
jgi:hypothetical protein